MLLLHSFSICVNRKWRHPIYSFLTLWINWFELRLTKLGYIDHWLQDCRPSFYFSTTVIVGFVLVLSMNTRLFPEIIIAVVPAPTFPTPFAEKE